MNRAEIKQKSKSQISGKLGILFLCNIIVIIISWILERLSLSNGTINMYILNITVTINIYKLIVTLLILPPIIIGFFGIYLGVARSVYPEVKNLFNYMKYYLKTVGLNLLVGLIILAGYILFIVPGIILALSLSQVEYIFADNPDMKVTDIISTSMSMMKGHKWEYFVLVLSFLGWYILGAILLGIPLIVYVIPYYMTTTANYYLELKDEYLGKMSNDTVSAIPPSSSQNINDTPWEIK